MDGYELLQRIRNLAGERVGNPIAIALSAHASDRERQKSLSAGYARHLIKPIDLNVFISVMVQLTNGLTDN